jgi:HSP20 family protein
MALVKYAPMRGFEGLAKRMQSFMDSFNDPLFSGGNGFNPVTDISEDENNIFIHVEIPGLNKDDLKVSLSDDKVLTIKGSKKRENENKEEKNGRTFIRIERGFGEFQRSFVLPENIKDDSIKAYYKDGVLNITLEKTEPVKPKEISISVA